MIYLLRPFDSSIIPYFLKSGSTGAARAKLPNARTTVISHNPQPQEAIRNVLQKGYPPLLV